MLADRRLQSVTLQMVTNVLKKKKNGFKKRVKNIYEQGNFMGVFQCG